MEADKQEKYILLNNDSDPEEFDKSKVLLHPIQKGKLLSRSHKTKKFSSDDQPQRFCHTFFVLLLLIAQVSLSIFVLKMYQDLNTLKTKGAAAQTKASSSIAREQKDVETINNRKEQTRSKFKDITQQRAASTETVTSKHTAAPSAFAERNDTALPPSACQDESSLIECVYKLNMSTTLELHEMEGKIIQVHEYMHNLSDQFLSMETMVNSLFYAASSQQLQSPVPSKMNVLEKRLENATATLNHLQSRLEEELDDIFLQLSQLKDNLYVLENTWNITQQEHLNYYTSTTQVFQEKGKGVNTPGYRMPSQNDDISAIPETTSRDPTEAVDSEILEQKPKITISFIKNLTDLQVFFYGADSNANGYLTFDEMQSLLGEETPDWEQLKLFDVDGNQVFSYRELIRALGLTE